MKQPLKNNASVPVIRVSEAAREQAEASVAREYMLTIFLNRRELVTIMCSPENMKELSVGFLCSEGLIRSKKDIKKLEIDQWMGAARVETVGDIPGDSRFYSKRLLASGCGGSAPFYDVSDAAVTAIESSLTVPASEVAR